MKKRESARRLKRADERCLAGLHDTVWSVMAPLLDALPCQSIIDMGSGSGGLIGRFPGDRFCRVACDLDGSLADNDRWDKFYESDIDVIDAEDLVQQVGTFGLTIAVEIIEHLENPWRLMRVLSSILEAGGYCLITTPNNQNEASRVDMLTHGELPWFKVSDIEKTKHISPIFLQQFYLMAIHAGFDLVRHIGFAEDPPPSMNWRGRLVRSFMRNRIMRGPGLDGVIHIWVLQKTERRVDRSVPKVTAGAIKSAIRMSELSCECIR